MIHLGPMEVAERRRMAETMLDGCVVDLEALVADGEGETPAQFRDRCIATAFRLMK